jgi:hypothetical protein
MKIDWTVNENGDFEMDDAISEGQQIINHEKGSSVVSNTIPFQNLDQIIKNQRSAVVPLRVTMPTSQPAAQFLTLTSTPTTFTLHVLPHLIMKKLHSLLNRRLDPLLVLWDKTCEMKDVKKGNWDGFNEECGILRCESLSIRPFTNEKVMFGWDVQWSYVDEEMSNIARECLTDVCDFIQR